MEIGDKYYLQDTCDSHHGQEGTIINVKTGPFGKGILVDIKFSDGYVLPDVLPCELIKRFHLSEDLNQDLLDTVDI